LLRLNMLQVAVDNHEPLAGRHTDQSIRKLVTPFLDSRVVRRGILESALNQRTLLAVAGEDGDAPIGEIKRD
jgi:hypothetical protein